MSQVPPPPQQPPAPGPDSPPPAVASFLKEIPPNAWARTFLIVAVFFGGALIMAGVIAGLFTAGVGAAVGNGFPAELDAVLGGGPTWIVMTFQLLAMGFLSPLSLGVDFAELGMHGAGGSLFFVPWFVPAGGIAAVVATQRHLGGNLRARHIGTRLLLAALAGVTFATVVTVLAAAIRLRFDEATAMFGVSAWAHAASFPGFIVAALLVGFITYLLFLPQRGTILQRAMTSITQVFEHVIALSIVGIVLGIIYGATQGTNEGLVMVLGILPSLGFFLFSALHFIPMIGSGSAGIAGVGEAESFHIFDAHPGIWIPGLVIMVLALGISAFRWNVRTNFQAHTTWAWVTLPVTYLLAGMLLTFGNGIYFSMFAEGEGFQITFSSASWGFLIWAIIGAIVQLLAVFVMPQLARRTPAGLSRTLVWGVTPAAVAAAGPPSQQPYPSPTDHTEQFEPVDQTTPMHSVPPPPGAAPAPSAAPEGVWQQAASEPRQPREPMSRTTKILLWTGLGVLVLAAIAWIAHSVLARTVFGPQHTAESYLEAVVDGRAEDALEEMGPNVTDQQRVLATDDVYQAAENRPDRFELGDVTRDGTSATVQATVYQDGKAYPIEFGLSVSGTQAGVFRDWAMDSGDLAGRAVYMSGPSNLTVNDTEIDIEPTGQELEDSSADSYALDDSPESVQRLAEETGQVLLPGTYTFTAPEGSKYLSSGDDLVLTVTPGEISSTPIEFSQRYTEEFEQDTVAQVEQRLESCLADGSIRVDDCEAASWEDTGWNAMTDLERTWDTAPEIELVPSESDPYASDTEITEYSGPVTARVVEGRINATYQVRDDEDQDWMERDRTYSPFGDSWLDPMEFPVTLDGDEINIDFSALDEYNTSWLSQESRD